MNISAFASSFTTATLGFARHPMQLVRETATFPFVALPTRPGGLPIEVTLLARLGRGVGTGMCRGMMERQGRHGRFIDALDEPSAKLGGSDFAKGDATALYSFGVGQGGHLFHRHAGHRVFTAVSGSTGAQLRFSSATPDEIARDPAAFVRALRYVEVPPDCLFTVRFSGENWHQFVPRVQGSGHPAFFALSVHTNELGGSLSAALRQRVLQGEGDIPSLTELLPDSVRALMGSAPVQAQQVPTTVLSLGERPGGWLAAACGYYRAAMGRLGSALARLLGPRQMGGYVSELRPSRVQEQLDLPADSLLRQALPGRTLHHEDCFTLVAPIPSPSAVAGAMPDAPALLAGLLGSFLEHRHPGITRMMAVRNALVYPLRLRRSPLACPVSSLQPPIAGQMMPKDSLLFADRYPVHASQVAADGHSAQVLLGADDRHLAFRSCIGVRCLEDGRVEYSLSTRVACHNAFGRLYMALIERTHRRYIAPHLLQVAVEGMEER